ncbi:MAG: phytase [Acidobacteria bacterium]|nr:phytase [Acidobacteriota bacterium]
MRLFLLTALLAAPTVDIQPWRETAPEPHQTDDPAIWLNPRHPSDGFILGTIKMAAPDGAIAVYRLDGTRLMRIPNLDRPNNIDVAYGLKMGTRTIDIAVATERNKQRLRIFEILPNSGIRDLAALPVFEGQSGPAAQPMGIALYKRPGDHAIFAIVSRKSGPSGSYLWQYRIEARNGALSAAKVREFGQFSGSKEIEAIAVDHERGFVYYSDEGAGIRRYHADPAHPAAAKELALFAQSGWKGDREGLAVYKDYIIATDQQHPNSEFHVFSRDTLRELGIFRLGAGATDGIDIASNGLFVAMNDSRHNFLIAHWPTIAAALRLAP